MNQHTLARQIQAFAPKELNTKCSWHGGIVSRSRPDYYNRFPHYRLSFEHHGTISIFEIVSNNGSCAVTHRTKESYYPLSPVLVSSVSKKGSARRVMEDLIKDENINYLSREQQQRLFS